MADSYTLYLKSHNYHWNVTGPHFGSLHALFEEHYLDLADAVDLIAERIRALGFPAPGSYREFGELTNVPEAAKNVPAMRMVEELANDHRTVAAAAAAVIAVASKAGDEPTAGMATDRQEVHEKAAWMLRSFLE